MRLILMAALALALTGCSMFGGAKPQQLARQDQVLEFLDAGKPKAALVVADELVAEAPDDYRSYLTRNTVYLVLKDFAAASADNEKALQVFEAGQSRYPQKERAYRMAKIQESFALTALLASRRASDPAERKRLENEFEARSAKVKELDQETWTNLRGIAGQPVDQK
ncbi:MAG: hypothetical protein ACLGQW_12665 [Acidobacteriota bacterium]